ncbi:predicted protein [Arabidopsis lyrata subsp. lyrata]|uniref:Predicted protein n=1 Tax=Arabidopsis lyrata subsp. lyrata TaxID=81972 RepID=D7M4Z4_ARALL|nr:predicted protein [Arabidopsis lyrata subsp. lyrata]
MKTNRTRERTAEQAMKTRREVPSSHPSKIFTTNTGFRHKENKNQQYNKRKTFGPSHDSNGEKRRPPERLFATFTCQVF